MSVTSQKAHLLRANKTNPASWWIAGISLSLVSSLTGNLLVLISICIGTMLTVFLARDESPWAKSIGFYLKLAAVVVSLRVVFRIIFNLGTATSEAFLLLPSLEFDVGFGNTIHLFGPMSELSLMAAFTDGFRLAAIILSVGMANSLANPRKILKATPGALYEIATAISIAINLAPQLISSLNRVRRARSLRGRSKGIKSLAGIVIPVLEDTIEQSMALAASMSARGFGRRGRRTALQILIARLLGFLAVCLCVTGVVLLLISPDQQFIDLAIVFLGLVAAGFTIRISSTKATRTRYRSEPWRLGDVVVFAVSITLLLLAFGGAFAA